MLRFAWALIGLATAVPAAAEWSGWVAPEAWYFPREAADPAQHGSHFSLAVRPEYHRDWDGGRRGFSFVPFARWDGGDPERTHADVRELIGYAAGRSWEFRAGIGKVFWGVTESQHLVDVINQTDLVESPDGEEKLGQPMVNVAHVGTRGIWQLFVLPGFRERTFPGEEGRLRSAPYLDTSLARYESGAEARHVDWAVRWSHYMGPWDIGVSHFAGTGREPTLVPERGRGGDLVLVPRYELIRQTGLDLQMTRGGWLWKLEWIRRGGQGEPFRAATGGFEYTFTGVLGGRADLGVLAEYLYDERGDEAPTPFTDDLFTGLRLAMNDAASTQVLFGAVVDGDDSLLFMESSRRLGNHVVAELEARVFSIPESSTVFSSFARDDYVRLMMLYYF